MIARDVEFRRCGRSWTRTLSLFMQFAQPGLWLPPGYTLEVGGEEEERIKGFKQLSVVLLISVTAIFLAFVFQFKNAVKPFIVFAAVPYGIDRKSTRLN